MIHIYHGENHDLSRKELQKLTDTFKDKELVVLDGKSATLTQLTQSTQSQSLFGGDRLVVIENLLSKRLSKKSADVKVLTMWIKDLKKTDEVAFWEEKELSKTTLNLFGSGIDVAVFKPDRALFTFVESLRPGNQKESLILLHEALSLDAIELIFSMVSRQLRLLLTAKDNGKLELAPWQLRKIQKQAHAFTLEHLYTLYHALLDIDVTIKSGLSPFTLKEQVELLITKI